MAEREGRYHSRQQAETPIQRNAERVLAPVEIDQCAEEIEPGVENAGADR
jgi:hypothetical protein